jgi:hypothetical protein
MSRVSAVDAARNPALSIVPVATMSYCDSVQAWLKMPLPRTEIRRLREQCDLHVLNRPKRWDRTYRQRLQLRQPSLAALQFLAGMNEVLINRVEIALDWIFARALEGDAAHELIRRYHVKRWHGDQEVLLWDGITRYTAPPWHRAPNRLVSYGDGESRMTGEPHCLHLDWRLQGVSTLRRAAMGSLPQLLQLDLGDLRRFWQQRLLLRTVDFDRLGRLHCFHVQGRGPRRGGRGPWLDRHARTGFMLWLTCGSLEAGTASTTQALIDDCRRKWRLEIGRCLEPPLDVSHLLPAEQVWPSWEQRQLHSLL